MPLEELHRLGAVLRDENAVARAGEDALDQAELALFVVGQQNGDFARRVSRGAGGFVASRRRVQRALRQGEAGRRAPAGVAFPVDKTLGGLGESLRDSYG